MSEAEKDAKSGGEGPATSPGPVSAVSVPSSGGPLALPEQLLPPNLFVLPSSGPIVFPTLLGPLAVAEPRFIATVEEAIGRQRILGILLTRNGEVKDDAKAADLHAVGVAVKILKRLKLPDGSIQLLVHSLKRFRARKVLTESPNLVVEAEYLDDLTEKSTEMDALARAVIAQVKKLAEVNPFFTDEMRLALINAPVPGNVADLVAFALSLPRSEAQEFLETQSVRKRFETLLTHLRKEQAVADVQKRIHDEVNTRVAKSQREFFLKEQLRSIQKELGIEEDGKSKVSRGFRERIEAAGMPEDTKKTALEELAKLESLNEISPEYNVTRNYLETLCSLPWAKETKDTIDIDRAKGVLDEDHLGLEKVKERILEFLAVRILKNETKGSILCLVGPPGVGKTSMGRSIAKTMGRQFFRFSLGGMRDEAEIKGHRRTYVGAMPGKILQGMKRAGTRNPVLMLDEIDKLGASFQGDPASALLEVLDPEQNHAFLDHYVDAPFDLSKVLFIATANSSSTIPSALLDRMEVIELPGYTLEEKEEIALRHVVPKEIRENGLKPGQLRIDRATLRKILADYAREPGMRAFQQAIRRIARKTAAKLVSRSARPPVVVRAQELREWLGPHKFFNEAAERVTAPGVATGLAWTAMGGDILFIEAVDLPGEGNLKLTGQLGEVMTESAAIAWSTVKRLAADEFGIDRDAFKTRDIHVHLPAGAIPKDGPSAGITLATALYSLVSGRKVRAKLAMTGELSLVGKVLPVGGIKEKVLAAKRAGVTDLVMPKLNEKDLDEIPEETRRELRFHWVNRLDEVLTLALEETPSRPRLFAPKTSSKIVNAERKISSGRWKPQPNPRAPRKPLRKTPQKAPGTSALSQRRSRATR